MSRSLAYRHIECACASFWSGVSRRRTSTIASSGTSNLRDFASTSIFYRARACKRSYNVPMIRIREILDPELRQKILAKLAERRGCTAAAIPEWFELDDADYVDLLNDLKEVDPDIEPDHDSRM